MLIYKLLGVDHELVDFWNQVHDDFIIKGNYSWMLASQMRTTG